MNNSIQDHLKVMPEFQRTTPTNFDKWKMFTIFNNDERVRKLKFAK